METQIRTLKADIKADLRAVTDIYAALNCYSSMPTLGTDLPGRR